MLHLHCIQGLHDALSLATPYARQDIASPGATANNNKRSPFTSPVNVVDRTLSKPGKHIIWAAASEQKGTVEVDI